MDSDPNSQTRTVELVGTSDAIATAGRLINEVLAEAEDGGSGVVTRRVPGQAGSDEFVMMIPNNKVGLIIGKGGETIKSMQPSTGARIQVIPLHLPPGDPSTERTLKIEGTSEQIESAKQLVNEVVSGEVIVGYLLPGSLIGPGGLKFISEMVEVETIAQFGVVFLLFALGLEFSLAKVCCSCGVGNL